MAHRVFRCWSASRFTTEAIPDFDGLTQRGRCHHKGLRRGQGAAGVGLGAEMVRPGRACGLQRPLRRIPPAVVYNCIQVKRC